jgi:septal ring factor EnvC (AmiA/AmiB activator)
MMMPKITFPKEMAERVIKKITLEMVYKVVEEKTAEIKEDIAELRQKQEEDFRYLSQKIDTEIGQVRQEIGQVRQEIGQVNQRLDTIMQMLVEVLKQK